jgi:alanine racemase
MQEGQPDGIAAAADRAGAWLTIDLDAIRANYRGLCARLGGAACAGVVKADGYGLGAAQVARALLDEGCGTFFVAHLDEALALRRVLPKTCVIYVLNGLPPGAERDCLAAFARPVLNSLEQVEAWAALGARAGSRFAAALQVDSGMSRLGLAPADVDRLAARPDRLEGIDLALVMSHLACADEPAHPANAAQLQAFETLRAKLPAAPASLANSSGIFLGRPWHFELARPGAALYGINPRPGSANPMRSVVRIEARVIQLRAVAAGAGIGYGHRAIADGPKRLATLSIGYADGWLRAAGAAAFWRGLRLPFIGRVSMDSIILDVSAEPCAALRPGMMVDLVTAEQGIDDIASLAGTIGYEVLTRLGARYDRRYIGLAKAPQGDQRP